MNFIPEIGSVVQLNSGGPSLVVTQYGSNGTVFCSWFDDENRRQLESFPIACLRELARRKPLVVRQPLNEDGTEFGSRK